MSFTYTITDVSEDRLHVDYGGGIYAIIPLIKGKTKAELEEMIRHWGPKITEPYDSVDDVPLKKGDTATLLGIDEEQAAQTAANKTAIDNRILDYQDVRTEMYPSVFSQLDALYWARKGDSSKLDLIDSVIDDVKTIVPKDSKTMTQKEYLEAYETGTLGDRSGKKKRISMSFKD